MSEKVMVTGGAGFIGSNLSEALLKQGYHVRVYDSFITGKKENLVGFEKDIELIEGDIRNIEPLQKALKGCDYIFHHAALRSVPKSVDDPVMTNEINVAGTLNVLMAAQKENVKKLVYASSSSVYGDNKTVPQSEECCPMPASPYAVSKLAGEHYCRMFSQLYSLYTVSLRYFNVFGPKQDPESKYSAVVPKFIQQAIKDEPYEIHGDGTQSRDFTYISNVVDANLCAVRSENIGGEYFNVACGATTSVRQIAESVSKILNKPVRLNFTPRRAGDVMITHADVTKVKKLMNYEGKINFEEGLKTTVAFLAENQHRL